MNRENLPFICLISLGVILILVLGYRLIEDISSSEQRIEERAEDICNKAYGDKYHYIRSYEKYLFGPRVYVCGDGEGNIKEI